MRIALRPVLLAAAAALLAGAAVAPVLAQGWHGRGGPSLFDTYDTNEDGKLTQAEVDAARQQQLTRFDRDGNGRLTLEEYQALWLDAMREPMVRRFQAHDRDGDAVVTVEEFQARFSDLVEDRDDNNDGELTQDELRSRGHGHGRDRDRDRDRGPDRDDG
jgi:Ca2+-binding EF-hand superfamily protein